MSSKCSSRWPASALQRGWGSPPLPQLLWSSCDHLHVLCLCRTIHPECGCCGPIANHGLYDNANEQAQFEQAQSCYEVPSTDAVLGEYDGGVG